MKFIHLSEKFYKDYPKALYPEMMLKENRPYTQIVVKIKNMTFAVPLRSNISHKNDVIWTDKIKKHGLDFTKAVLILKDEYIKNNHPKIKEYEYKRLIGMEHRAVQKMEKHIENYKKAKNNPHNKYDRMYCEYSTLQYFEEYI